MNEMHGKIGKLWQEYIEIKDKRTTSIDSTRKVLETLQQEILKLYQSIFLLITHRGLNEIVGKDNFDLGSTQSFAEELKTLFNHIQKLKNQPIEQSNPTLVSRTQQLIEKLVRTEKKVIEESLNESRHLLITIIVQIDDTLERIQLDL